MRQNWPQVLPRLGNLKFERLRSDSNWFEIFVLNDMTYAFLEPNHLEEVISYLIIGREQAVLFDSGMGIGDIYAEVVRITHLPLIVINSHSHYDHIGGNYQFKNIWSFKNEFENVRIERGYSNSECRKYLTEESYINLPKNFDVHRFYVPGVRINKYLHDKEEIDLGRRRLTVHHTPGETPGAISLFDDMFKILFVGDLIYPAPIWLHLEESSWVQFVRSVKHVKTMYSDILYICPAHNEVCLSKDFIDEVERSIDLITTTQVKGEVLGEKILYDFGNFGISLPNGASVNC